MRPPIDVATRVSPELSTIMELMVNDPDREEEATLGELRTSLTEIRGQDASGLDRLHPHRESASVELDALIEEYGEEAAVSDFIRVKASEGLSRVIEAAMDHVGLTDEPTLGDVRTALAQGLAARLFGAGTIEVDDDATLLSEIDELIRLYGVDALAEEFIRFE